MATQRCWERSGVLVIILLLSTACNGNDESAADEAEDLALTLHQLGFDPHHRQFITKLHDRGMLGFLSDKDLVAVGMSQAQIDTYRSLAAHLQSGTPMPTGPGATAAADGAASATSKAGAGGVALAADADDGSAALMQQIKMAEDAKRCASATRRCSSFGQCMLQFAVSDMCAAAQQSGSERGLHGGGTAARQAYQTPGSTDAAGPAGPRGGEAGETNQGGGLPLPCRRVTFACF